MPDTVLTTGKSDRTATSNRDWIPFPWVSSNTDQWVFAFAVLGIVVRVVRYLERFPLTGDEARRADSLIGASYAQLTKPMLFRQVSPISFLWTESFLTKHLGFNEYALRLVPTLCGVASVILFVRLAKRVLSGAALVVAVGVFAVSHELIRLGNEAKPYSIDLFVALVFVSLIVEWWHDPTRVRWLWGLTLFTPLALVLSFPSVFVAGAIVIAFTLHVWRRGDQTARWAFGFFVAALGCSFLLLLKFVIGPQYHNSPVMINDWVTSGGFLPITHPWRTLLWLLHTFTGPVMLYPVGGPPPGSSVTLVLFVIGMIALWKDRASLVTLTSAMIALGLAAAALHRYPFGRVTRVTLYLAPSICLAVGVGLVQATSWLRRPHWQTRALRWVIYAMFFVIGLGELVLEVAQPYKGSGTEMHRGFARWFWQASPDRQTVCVDLDLHRKLYGDFPPHTYLEPAYPCYRAMYDRSKRGNSTNGLRCVFTHVADATRNDVEFDSWMSKMLADYKLTEHYTYQLALESGGKIEPAVYEAYYFTPR